MQKKNSFLAYFLIFLALSLVTIGLSKSGLLSPLNSLFKGILSPLETLAYGSFSKITSFVVSSQLQSLKTQNSQLTQKLVDQNKLIEDNKALRDQFQTQTPKSSSLIEADVIGAPGFIPGISVPENLILDRGEHDGVKVGKAVVYQNNLVGKVIKTSQFLSEVMLITNSSSSFTAKTLSTQCQGVVKGQGGGGLILDNVVLSDNLQNQDIVLTKGDVNEQGIGFPPDLIVGKISSISKNPSDLFQKAAIKNQINFAKLSKVFVIVR